MSKQIISLSGFAGVGKDTVGQILVDDHGYTRVAFADAVKELAASLADYLSDDIYFAVYDDAYKRIEPNPHRYAWPVQAEDFDAAKSDPGVREFLQHLGTEAVRGCVHPDAWIFALEHKASVIIEAGGKVVITDARFQNELAWVEGQGGTTWRIDRPGVEAPNNHASEHDWNDWWFEGVLDNSGSIEDLRDKVHFAARLGAVVGDPPFPSLADELMLRVRGG